jgi:15-cis-phytoene synthase
MIQLFHDTSHKCSKLTTELYSTSFSSAIRMLHSDLHEPIYDIYGFVRFADEIVDTFHAFEKEKLLQEFITETNLAIERGISLNPILHSFQLTVNKFKIDKSLIAAFFKSMQMDLDKNNYDEQAYSTYIYGSAEVVGLMCLYVFCNGDKNEYEKLKPYAQSLGAAFQKINFLRDLKADHQDLNRTYFPGVDFKNFTPTDKLNIEKDIAADFEKAKIGIAMLPNKARFGVYVAYKYYIGLFNKIKSTTPNVLLEQRVRVSNSYKAVILVKASLRNSFNAL